MTEIGNRVELAGILVRDAGGFALRVEGAGIVRLLLHRVPVDLFEKRARVTGTLIDEELVEAEGVAPA